MKTPVRAPGQGRLAFSAWVVYDFANSLYSINVFGLYFILWLTVEKGRPTCCLRRWASPPCWS